MLRTHLPPSSSRSQRSLRAGLLVVFGVLMGVGSACSNISLSSGFAGVPSEGSSGGLSNADGGGSSGGNLVPGSDGAASPAAPSLLGNPLCNLRVGSDDGGPDRLCDPDDEEDGGALQCPLPDAGPLLDAAYVGQHPADGGDDGGAASDAAGVTPPVDANPPGSGAGPACRVAAPDAGALQVCSAAGTGKDGQQCQASSDCANGYECVGSPGQCRHYCCAGNAVCDVTYAPSFCNPEPVVGSGGAAGTFSVPVCIPVSGCSLFGKCQGDQTCAVVKDDGTTSCVPIGPQTVGEECDTKDCAVGLTCIGSVGSRACYQLCHVAWTSECAPGTTCTGSAQLFQDPQFGICR